MEKAWKRASGGVTVAEVTSLAVNPRRVRLSRGFARWSKGTDKMMGRRGGQTETTELEREREREGETILDGGSAQLNRENVTREGEGRVG